MGVSLHFTQKKNADFVWSQKFGANFTGSTFKMEIKDSTGVVQATLTTANGGIVATMGAQTTLAFFLAQSALPAIGSYSYDVLRVTDNGGDPDFLENIIGGNLTIEAGTTTP